MQRVLRIGTRDSQLAVWQATLVQGLLKDAGVASELVYIKSEGDIDTVTPLYALGVTGVFTKTLDAALLNNRIDIAVHSMKDVPVQLAEGIRQAAVLKRASHKDILVLHPDLKERDAHFIGGNSIISSDGFDFNLKFPVREHAHKPGEPEDIVIATSSIRRIAQWRYHFPNHNIENLRGNVNTRLRKLKESQWHGAIFAAAGLERIGLRPQNSMDLDWMLPAPAQGAIMIVCKLQDDFAFESCHSFNDEETALCTRIEREFLSKLMGGCSTPISALAKIKNGNVEFLGNIADPEGTDLTNTGVTFPLSQASEVADIAAKNILHGAGQAIIERIRNKGLNTNGEI